MLSINQSHLRIHIISYEASSPIQTYQETYLQLSFFRNPLTHLETRKNKPSNFSNFATPT